MSLSHSQNDHAGQKSVSTAEKQRQTLTESVSRRAGYELDVISQLQANLVKLEDLQGRLQFMMAEVSQLVKRR